MKDMGAVSGLLLAALRRPHELPGLEREGGNGEAEMRLRFLLVFFSAVSSKMVRPFSLFNWQSGLPHAVVREAGPAVLRRGQKLHQPPS